MPKAVPNVTVINVFARADNAYLGNGLLAVPLILSGLILLAACLVGYGLRLWLAALLLVAYIPLGIVVLPLLTQALPYPDSYTLLFAALPIAAVLLYLLLRRQPLAPLITVALAVLGLVLVWRVYGAGLDAFIPVDTIIGPTIKPPVLEPVPFLFCLLISAALFAVGRYLQRWWLPQPPTQRKRTPTAPLPVETRAETHAQTRADVADALE